MVWLCFIGFLFERYLIHHSFIHPSIHPFIHPFIHSFIEHGECQSTPILLTTVLRSPNSRKLLAKRLTKTAINFGHTKPKASAGYCGIGAIVEIVFLPMKWVWAKLFSPPCSYITFFKNTKCNRHFSSLHLFLPYPTGKQRSPDGQTCTWWSFTALETVEMSFGNMNGEHPKESLMCC